MKIVFAYNGTETHFLRLFFHTKKWYVTYVWKTFINTLRTSRKNGFTRKELNSTHGLVHYDF